MLTAIRFALDPRWKDTGVSLNTGGQGWEGEEEVDHQPVRKIFGLGQGHCPRPGDDHRPSPGRVVQDVTVVMARDSLSLEVSALYPPVRCESILTHTFSELSC